MAEEDTNEELVEPAEQIPEEKTFKLRKPLKLGKLEVGELTLHEPTAGELEQAQRQTTSVGQAISLIQIQSRHPRRLIESMTQRDLQECSDFFALFQASATEPTPPNSADGS